MISIYAKNIKMFRNIHTLIYIFIYIFNILPGKEYVHMCFFLGVQFEKYQNEYVCEKSIRAYICLTFCIDLNVYVGMQFYFTVYINV